jgi:hypothetical protein
VFYAIYSTLGKMSAFDQKYVRNGNWGHMCMCSVSG